METYAVELSSAKIKAPFGNLILLQQSSGFDAKVTCHYVPLQEGSFRKLSQIINITELYSLIVAR